MSYQIANNNFQLIVSLCDSIKQSGVTPTVALIKKHANRPLPLPEIIAVLKSWKLDPAKYHNTETNIADLNKPEAKTTDEIIRTLEARVEKLEQQMATLLQLQD
jgi:hypothetical protein